MALSWYPVFLEVTGKFFFLSSCTSAYKHAIKLKHIFSITYMGNSILPKAMVGKEGVKFKFS